MRLIKKISTFPFIVIGIIVFAVSLSFLIINQSSSVTVNVTGTSCPSSYSILASSSASGTTLNSKSSGLVDVDIKVPTTSTQSIEKIIMSASNRGATNTVTQKTVIGQAAVTSSGWNFKWATSLWSTGSSYVNLSAEVYLLGARTCTINSSTNSNYFTGSNSRSTMTVMLLGPKEPVFVGSTSNYSVTSTINDTSISASDLSQYRIIEWTKASDIGYFTDISSKYPSDTQRTFNSGQVPGNNTVSVKVIYGGTEAKASTPITVKPLETTPSNVNSATSTTTTAPTTNSGTAVTSSSASSETATTTQLSSSQVQITPVTKSCVEEVLTTKRYTEINSGASRPTAIELSKIATCFAPSKYILPSNFSPIDPVKVNNLQVSDNISVSNLENVTTKVDSKDKQTLKITGKTTPNSTVIIYVYSDPLVITTKSDNEGNWQYSIEDPLEPGKHEVYAIVDNGDGVYKRSDPMSFLISTASATATNPNGLSLTLSEPPKKTPTQSSSNLIIYVAGSIAVLVVALICLYMIFRSHHKHKVIIAQINKSAEIDKSSNNVTEDVNEVDDKNTPVNLKE